MQTADLATAPAFESPAIATAMATLMSQHNVSGQPMPSAGAPGSAGQTTRKRGRPSTKNRQSQPGTANGVTSNGIGDNGPVFLGTNANFSAMAMASPQYTANNQNGLFSSPADALPSPAHLESVLNCPSNNTTEKTTNKRIKRTDDHQLTIPFEFGWSRIVRFRWQAPSSQILAEVTYKSPSGRIFRSYAKINEFLAAEQANATPEVVSLLTPEMFSFSSRARISGTTFQKTTTSSQGLKEYREMTSDEVDHLLATMNDASRNKLGNPIPVYEQIFGPYQQSQLEITDNLNAIQDFSTNKTGATNDLNAIVNLSVNGRQPRQQQQLTTTGNNNANSCDTGNNTNKLFSPSTLTNSNSMPKNVNSFASNTVTGVGTGDEQQAMLMFMAAMFMQQQQRQQQQQQTVPLFPPRSVAGTDTVTSSPARDKAKTSIGNNENLSMSMAAGKNKYIQNQGIANIIPPVDENPPILENIRNLESSKTTSNDCDLNYQTSQPPSAINGDQTTTISTSSEDQTVKKQTAIQSSTTSSSMSSIDREIVRMQKWRKRQQERRLRLIELKQELNRQPVDDMMLIQRRPLPELPRFATYSLLAMDNQAIADCLQTFEFVQTFAGVLGLDVNGLPSLGSLERGIAAADRQSLLEVTDLLCRLVAIGLQDTVGWVDGAVHDLMIALQSDLDHACLGQNNRGVAIIVDTELWQQLPKLPIDRMTVTEACRQFLFVRNAGQQTDEVCNLSDAYFQTMNPRQRARVLAAVCDELLAYGAVLAEIERNLAKSVDLKRDLVTIQSQLRSLQQPPTTASNAEPVMPSPSKQQQTVDSEPVDVELKVELTEKNDQSETNGAPTIDEDVDGENSSKVIAAELKRLTRQEKNCRNKLVEATNRIRDLHLGFDRFGRSFWNLPHVGALLVHGSDFSEQLLPETAASAEKVTNERVESNKMDADTDQPPVDVNKLSNGDKPQSPRELANNDNNVDSNVVEDDKVTDNDQGVNETSNDSSSSSEGDDIEQARWSPPPNFVASEPQSHPQEAMVSINSPKLPRGRKSNSRPRKSLSSNTNTNTNNNNSSSGAIDLSQPNVHSTTNNPGDATVSSCEGVTTVTVEPAVLLQNFLLFARSLSMSSLSSQMPLTQQTSQPFPYQALSNGSDAQVRMQVNDITACSSDLKESQQIQLSGEQHIGSSNLLSLDERRVHFEDEKLGNENDPGTESQPVDDKAVQKDYQCNPDQQVEDIEPNPSPPSEPEDSPRTIANKELLYDAIQKVPLELQCGWWRITTMEQINALIHSLNPHGVRERGLLRTLQRNLTSLENVLVNSIDVATHGDMFKVEQSPDEMDNHISKCDLTALRTEMESEIFSDVVAAAKAVLAANQVTAPTNSGRGRPRKSLTNATITVKDMPEISSYCEKDDDDTPNGKIERARSLLLDIAYSLAAKQKLQPPFAVEAAILNNAESDDDNQDKNEQPTLYQFSESFLSFINAVKKVDTWPVIKLRLVQLEALSNVRFPKETTSVSSPKKQQRASKEELEVLDNVEDVVSACRQLLEALRNHQDSGPFQYPVDRVEYPTYFEVIETPMDFATIDSKIHQNCYRSVNEFVNDVRLVFSNCHEFNADGSEIYEQASRLKRFFERRLKQIV